MPTLPIRDWPLLLARCAFLMLLAAGLALWGGTQAGTQGDLEWALLAVGVLYAIGGVISTQGLHISRWLLAMALVLVILGWLSALNPASAFDLEGRVFIPISPRSKWPWGTVDAGLSIATMRGITSMLGALLMARDMGNHANWKRAALLVMAWCGVAEAAFGFAQRMNGDIGHYWSSQGADHLRETVFGCFWYHGNAGAFLNLCWPFAAMLAWEEFKRSASASLSSQLRRSLVVLALLVILSAVWTNHSRAAQAIFVLQLIITFVMLAAHHRLRALLIPAVISTIAITVVAVAFGLGSSLDKWAHFRDQSLATDGRWAVLQTSAKWFTEIPLLGYGPGTFSAVFIVKTTGVNDAPPGYWQFAHDDYLQTLLEWGWLGLALWLIPGCAILFSAFHRAREAGRAEISLQQVQFVAVAVALLSVALHAMVDFPLQIFSIQLYTACVAGLVMGEASATRSLGESGSWQRKRKHRGKNREGQAGAP